MRRTAEQCRQPQRQCSPHRCVPTVRHPPGQIWPEHRHLRRAKRERRHGEPSGQVVDDAKDDQAGEKPGSNRIDRECFAASAHPYLSAGRAKTPHSAKTTHCHAPFCGRLAPNSVIAGQNKSAAAAKRSAAASGASCDPVNRSAASVPAITVTAAIDQHHAARSVVSRRGRHASISNPRQQPPKSKLSHASKSPMRAHLNERSRQD